MHIAHKRHENIRRNRASAPQKVFLQEQMPAICESDNGGWLSQTQHSKAYTSINTDNQTGHTDTYTWMKTEKENEIRQRTRHCTKKNEREGRERREREREKERARERERH